MGSTKSRLSKEDKRELFNWAKGCNFNLDILSLLGGDSELIEIMKSASCANGCVMKLLNKEYQSNESIDKPNKFDKLLLHYSKIGISKNEILYNTLQSCNDSNKNLSFETKKMIGYYQKVEKKYKDLIMDIDDIQLRFIDNEINDKPNDDYNDLGIDDICCNENLLIENVIDINLFFHEFGDKVISKIQTHVGINENYISTNFETNDEWFNIGMYNDDGFSRKFIQRIQNPDPVLSESKIIHVHGKDLEIDNGISEVSGGKLVKILEDI